MAQPDHRRGVRAVPPFVDAYTIVSRPLARFIVQAARFMTIVDIACWLDLGWDTVKTAIKKRMEKDYRRIGYRHVRQLVREAGGAAAGATIKGIRWLLLARAKNLKVDSKLELEHCLGLNRPLQIAYLLKEELSLLWEQTDGRRAWAFMRRWCAKATKSGIPQLISITKTILGNAREILSYYRTRLTSGTVEGINRKIRGMLAAAYGLRDSDFLTLRLYALHESQWKLVG